MFFMIILFSAVLFSFTLGQSCNDDLDCSDGLNQCNGAMYITKGTCSPRQNFNDSPFLQQCTGWTVDSNYVLHCSECNNENQGQGIHLDLNYCEGLLDLSKVRSIWDPRTKLHFLGCEPQAIVIGDNDYDASCTSVCMIAFTAVDANGVLGNSFSATLICTCDGKRVSTFLPGSCHPKSFQIHARYANKHFKVAKCT